MDKKYLEPVIDSAKSFYKKAIVSQRDNDLILTSYSTEVAKIDLTTRIPEVFGFYSQTTTRHIKDFIYQYSSCGSLSTSEIRDKYTESGRKAIKEKEELKLKKQKERELARKEKEAQKELLRKNREARKAELLKELTDELGDCMSKSEIRKLVYQELREE